MATTPSFIEFKQAFGRGDKNPICRDINFDHEFRPGRDQIFMPTAADDDNVTGAGGKYIGHPAQLAVRDDKNIKADNFMPEELIVPGGGKQVAGDLYPGSNHGRGGITIIYPGKSNNGGPALDPYLLYIQNLNPGRGMETQSSNPAQINRDPGEQDDFDIPPDPVDLGHHADFKIVSVHGRQERQETDQSTISSLIRWSRRLPTADNRVRTAFAVIP